MGYNKLITSKNQGFHVASRAVPFPFFFRKKRVWSASTLPGRGLAKSFFDGGGGRNAETGGGEKKKQTYDIP